jgi:hypothetical protein
MLARTLPSAPWLLPSNRYERLGQLGSGSLTLEPTPVGALAETGLMLRGSSGSGAFTRKADDGVTEQRDHSPEQRVNATPAKRFFVAMLVKDIELVPAIVDLVDNSIDGAKRIRPDRSENRYEGLRVELQVEPERFVIKDNCGGIDAEKARSYAFRFGRPEEVEDPLGEIGQFGVGMKRALFKLGTKITVESTSTHSKFVLPIVVADWMEDTSPDWSFTFDSVEEGLEIPLEDTGTCIEISQLHPSIREDFAKGRFLGRLRAEIELRHVIPIQQGLAVVLNGELLKASLPSLLFSEEFQPIANERTIPVNGSEIDMRLYAGLAQVPDGADDDTSEAERFRDTSPAGWYLFCNERLLFAGDKSRLTGWGEAAAAYHPQYRQFRGYVFLEGEPRFMPWTTTKTAVDEDSAVFRAVQAHMFDALQKTQAVINRLKGERQQRAPEERSAVTAMQSARLVPLDDLPPSTRFRVPPPAPRAPSSIQWIRYSVEREDFDRVAAELGTDAPADVDRETFQFYLDTQVSD